LFKSLTFKINIAIGLVLLLIIWLVTVLDIRYQEREFEDATKEHANMIITTVVATLEKDMELGRQEEVQKILELIARSNSDITALRILSEEGKILRSSRRGEVGQQIEPRELALYQAYIKEKRLSDAAIIFEYSQQRPYRQLHALKPIYNQPKCHRCHEEDKGINGILELDLSLSYLDKRISTMYFIFILAATVVLLVTGTVLSVIIRRLIIGPLNQLREKMVEVSEGRWEIMPSKREQDEIGQLQQSFNLMVTNLEERERELKEYYARLVHSEKLAASGRIIANLSHELKTPLSIIKNYLALIKKGLNGDESVREKLRVIEEEIDRLSRMINNLLDMSRYPQGEIREVQINQLIQELLDSLETELRERSISLKKDLDPELPPVTTFVDQLKQVFMNLIKNAIEAMEKEGELSVNTSYRSAEERVVIAIRDTGYGIPEENMAHIFEPFFSTKKESGGTGLGLWISYRIVQALGGRIEVESKWGQGSTFLVSLPLKAY